MLLPFLAKFEIQEKQYIVLMNIQPSLLTLKISIRCGTHIVFVKKIYVCVRRIVVFEWSPAVFIEMWMKVLRLWSTQTPDFPSSLLQGNLQLNPMCVYMFTCVYTCVHVLPLDIQCSTSFTEKEMKEVKWRTCPWWKALVYVCLGSNALGWWHFLFKYDYSDKIL